MKTIIALLLIGGASLFFLTGCNKHNGERFGPSPTEETAQYQQYDQTKLDTAISEGKQAVVFFGATRCPPCRALDKDLKARIDEIPENVAIFAADHDLDTELQQQYEVTAKHTALYFDEQGQVSKKNTAKEHSLDDILAELDA